MQYSFVASLEFLQIDRPIGGNWQIPDGLKITNSDTVASRLVTDTFRQLVGALEANFIVSGRPFVFVESEYPNEKTTPEAQLALLNKHLRATQFFLTVMWLIKDNSINFNLGFLHYPSDSTSGRVTSNGRNIRFSYANATLSEGVFTTGELQAAIALYDSLFNPSSLELPLCLADNGPTKSDGRVSRAFYFLQGARGATSPAEKIALYCTCFETLVSTSPTELAHQVAERVAILLAHDSSEAFEIYRNMKKAYDTRSKLVHGGTLTTNQDMYITQSVFCDDYLRRLFHLLMTDREIKEAVQNSEESTNQLFLQKLFLGLQASQ